MKKKLVLLLLATVLALSTVACDDLFIDADQPSTENGSESDDAERSKQLQEKYEFYETSIDKLKTDLELTTMQANSAFEILVRVGLDEDISYCFSKDGYYTIWWGPNQVDVYMTDGTIEKILEDDFICYPRSYDLKWDDNEKIGTLRFELDGTKSDSKIVTDFSNIIVDYLNHDLDKASLKDYEYITFTGSIMKDGLSIGVLSAKLSIDYIKNTETFSVSDVEDNYVDIFIPKTMQ